MTSKVNSNIFRRKNVSLHSPIRHEGDGQELEVSFVHLQNPFYIFIKLLKLYCLF